MRPRWGSIVLWGGLLVYPLVVSFTDSGDCPLGNAVATLATFTVEPASAAFATGTRFG